MYEYDTMDVEGCLEDKSEKYEIPVMATWLDRQVSTTEVDWTVRSQHMKWMTIMWTPQSCCQYGMPIPDGRSYDGKYMQVEIMFEGVTKIL